MNEISATSTAAAAATGQDAHQDRQVTLNGVPVELGESRLDLFLDAQGFGGMTVATAVNGEFVAAAKRPDVELRPGDTVEVVSARQGG